MNTKFTKLFLCVALCLAVVPGTHAAGLRGRELSGKKCGNAAGEAACIAACAMPPVSLAICLSDACYGPNGPDFSPSCGKDDSRRLAGIFDKKPEGSICTYTPDCQGNLECYSAEMVGPIQVSRCQKS